MKSTLTVLLALALGASALADAASHRKAAEDLVGSVAGPKAPAVELLVTP